MLVNLPATPGSHLVLGHSRQRITEIVDSVALDAANMTVIIQPGVVPSLPATGRNSPDIAGLNQKCKIAVYGTKTYVRQPLPDGPV